MQFFPYGNIIAIIGSMTVIIGTAVLMAVDIDKNPPLNWIKTFGGIWT